MGTVSVLGINEEVNQIEKQGSRLCPDLEKRILGRGNKYCKDSRRWVCACKIQGGEESHSQWNTEDAVRRTLVFTPSKMVYCHPSRSGRFMVFMQMDKYSQSRWDVWHAFIHGCVRHTCCKLRVYMHVSYCGPCSPAWHPVWHLPPCVSLIIIAPPQVVCYLFKY